MTIKPNVSNRILHCMNFREPLYFKQHAQELWIGSLFLLSAALTFCDGSAAHAQGRVYTEPGQYDYQPPRASQNNNNNNNNVPSYNRPDNGRSNGRSYNNNNSNSGNSSNNNNYYGIPAQQNSSNYNNNNTDANSSYKPNYNQQPSETSRNTRQQRDYGSGSQDQGGRAPDYAPNYNDTSPRPPYRDQPRSFSQPRLAQSYTEDEIKSAGHRFFGNITTGLAKVIAKAFRRNGRPNGYILGEEGGGAFIAGLRYGEGKIYTKSLGTHPIFWQGPSIGYDFGASGSKSMTLIYNLQNIDFIYQKFGGVSGSAYVVGGVGLTLMKRDNVTLAPIRAGVGLRLGANIGYLKFTRRPTWNPF